MFLDLDSSYYKELDFKQQELKSEKGEVLVVSFSSNSLKKFTSKANTEILMDFQPIQILCGESWRHLGIG